MVKTEEPIDLLDVSFKMDSILGVDFRYVIPEDKKLPAGIELLSGNFAGIIYNYDDVKFEERDGDCYLTFKYNILETPFERDFLNSSIEFKNKLGEILTSIIDMQIGLKETDSESTTDNTEKSDI